MAETAAQLEARLAAVRTAINDILVAAQSYSSTGVSVNRASLKELRDYEKQLELKLSRMTSGGAVKLSDFSGGGTSGS